jgi:hypothetical protein
MMHRHKSTSPYLTPRGVPRRKKALTHNSHHNTHTHHTPASAEDASHPKPPHLSPCLALSHSGGSLVCAWNRIDGLMMSEFRIAMNKTPQMHQYSVQCKAQQHMFMAWTGTSENASTQQSPQPTCIPTSKDTSPNTHKSHPPLKLKMLHPGST